MGLASFRHSRPFTATRGGFTLVELLVVVAIIALLLGILLPAMGKARKIAKATVSMNNLRQIGIGVQMYKTENNGYYPLHSSLKSETTALGNPRTRWADYIYPYMQNTKVYLSPLLSKEDFSYMTKPFAHTVDPGPTETDQTEYFGGYGYNYQYLGNSRRPDGVSAYFANDSDIRMPSDTVAVGDTKGARKGVATNPYGTGGSGVYVIDPPLGSKQLGSRGSRDSSSTPGAGNAYYEGGNDGSDAHRSTPSDRSNGKVAISFADGHADTLQPDVLDGLDDDGVADNKYFNGRFDATIE